MPADMEDASLTPHMKGVQSFPIGLCTSSSFGAIKPVAVLGKNICGLAPHHLGGNNG